MSAPVAIAKRKHGRIEAAEGAEDEKHVCVGGAIIDSGRHVGHAYLSTRAGGDVDLVVAGALGEVVRVRCQEEK